MLAITLVSVFLCLSIILGTIVAFEDVIGLHPVCAESLQIVRHEPKLVPVFEIPPDMVFWGEEVLSASEEADMDFWPSAVEMHAYNTVAVHSAMIRFSKEQERVISWTLPFDDLHDAWFWTDASA